VSEIVAVNPLLLLDVDGVINPRPRQGYDGHDLLPAKFYTIGHSKPSYIGKVPILWSAMAYDDRLDWKAQYYFIEELKSMLAGFNGYMMEQLSWIIQEDACETRWLTTWDQIPDKLRTLERAIFDGDFREDERPVLPIVPRVHGAYHLDTKLDAVRELVAQYPGRKIVWVDDDAWEIDELPDNVYVVAPNPLIGLTLRETETIRKLLGLKTWAQIEKEYDAEVEAELESRNHHVHE